MTQHDDGFTDSDREAVLKALADEQQAKAEGRPYSEAVITACEVALRVFARVQDHGLEATNRMRAESNPLPAQRYFAEPRIKHQKETPNPEIPADSERPGYWWMRD